MKYLILLLIGSLIVVAKAATKQDLIDKLAQEAPDCKGKYTDTEIEEFVTNSLNPSYNTKCLRQCLFLKFGLMDIENKLNVNKVVKVFEDWYGPQDAEKGLAIATDCSLLPVGVDSCEAAHTFFKCGIEGIQKKSLPVEAPQ